MEGNDDHATWQFYLSHSFPKLAIAAPPSPSYGRNTFKSTLYLGHCQQAPPSIISFLSIQIPAEKSTSTNVKKTTHNVIKRLEVWRISRWSVWTGGFSRKTNSWIVRSWRGGWEGPLNLWEGTPSGTHRAARRSKAARFLRFAFTVYNYICTLFCLFCTLLFIGRWLQGNRSLDLDDHGHYISSLSISYKIRRLCSDIRKPTQVLRVQERAIACRHRRHSNARLSLPFHFI